MSTFTDQFYKLSQRLAEKYRLTGQPIFSDTELVFMLLGHLAQSNGKACDRHQKQAVAETKLLHLTDHQIQIALQAYQTGQTLTTANFEPSLRYFKQGEIAKQLLLQSCWRMIWVDNHLAVREYQLIHLWGYWLGWSRPAIEQLGIEYRPVYISQQHQQALALLEVNLNSSPATIKRMYQRKLSIHHPDKVIGAGGNALAIQQATTLTTNLHQAYALLRMLHNF